MRGGEIKGYSDIEIYIYIIGCFCSFFLYL